MFDIMSEDEAEVLRRLRELRDGIKRDGLTFPVQLERIVMNDVLGLVKARENYGESWCKRGGVGAFMMLARKWDRLEQAVLKHGYDIQKLIESDQRAEGVIDDIRDLRRYLLLVEEKWAGSLPEVKK